ncbi:MAG: hypothetical protein Q7S20_08180 [Gemmatimonadaceae bacterium]|nr:hypothetical protein [Gemmatimonadaceae bacterium]
MQVPTVQSPVAPEAPQAPVSVTFTGVDGAKQVLAVPLTRRAIVDLRAKRSELSSQLNSAEGRRHRLSEEIRSAPAGASRTGLEGRLAVLDKRIVQLESDIAATGQQLSAAPRGLIASTEAPNMNGDISDNVAAIAAAFTVFVLFPIAIAIARFIWKRAGKARPLAQLPEETGQRLERLEQGVDAIAIEIERVAEGQRFVTRLLSEGQSPVIALQPAQGADEVRVQSTGQ